MIRSPALLFVLLLALPLPAVAQPPAEEPYHILAVGGEEVVELDFVPDQNHMQSVILEVKPGAEPNQLRVVGLSTGKASFLVKNKKGEVFRRVKFHVIKLEQFQRYTSVQRLLRGIPGTRVTFEGDNIVVDGTAGARDFERVQKIEKAYPEILNLVNEKE